MKKYWLGLAYSNKQILKTTSSGIIKSKLLLKFNYKNITVTNSINPLEKEISSDEFDRFNKKQLYEILKQIPLQEVKTVDKILKYLPEATDKVINEYLNNCHTQDALYLSEKHKNISMATYKKLEKYCENDFVSRIVIKYLERDKNRNNDDFPRFIHLYEFAIHENIKNLTKIVNKLCESKKYKECYEIMKFHNFDKNIKLSMINNFHFENFVNSSNFEEENLFEEKFHPLEEKLKLGINQSSVYFIDRDEQINVLDKFINSDIIGIDCEWKPSTYKNSDTRISLMQLSDLENVVIIDMLKLRGNSKFVDRLCFILNKMKKIICNSFYYNDLVLIEEPIKNFLKKNDNLVEILDFYFNKTKIREKSIQRLCMEIYGKRLCKIEQCSNWEVRPLRERQIYYAALDSFILCKLYHDISKIEDIPL